MNKRLLLILMTLLPMVASAYKGEVWINGFKYYIDTQSQTAEVRGYDDSKYFEYVFQFHQNSFFHNIYTVIPETVEYEGVTCNVTSIGYRAFADYHVINSYVDDDGVLNIETNGGFTGMYIPNSVTTIGEGAFSNNQVLRRLIVGSGVTEIKYNAFMGCDSIDQVFIPDITAWCNISFTSEWSNPLAYAPYLLLYDADYSNDPYYNIRNGVVINDLVIPEGVKNIGDYAFYGYKKLASVTIPNSVTSIGYDAFAGCSGLTSITIPNSVTSIGSSAFYQCSGLTSIKVESGNTNYDSRDNCNAIIETTSNTLIVGCQNTTIPNSVTSIGSSAFSGCSGLTSITIPNSVTSIGSSAFSGCSGLTSITIPNSVTSIGSSAFYQCSGLTSITIGNSVTSIGSSAFYYCSGLTSITIPNSVTSIGDGAFSGCRLESVLTRSISINIKGGGRAFSDRTYQHAMLYIPEGTWSEAVYDSPWYLFNNIRETALQVDDLSQSRVYTLIDTKTFGYAVYNEAKGEVTMATAFYSIDEQDVNNCWMVMMQGGKKCLYNVGAKKYAAIGADGSITLTDNATPIEVSENENGLVLGGDNSHQWGFVKNNSVTNITGIAPVVSNIGQSAESYYSVGGKRTSSPQKGLNIVRMSDGTTKKVVK